ncbi:MAG: glycosyltransferase family 2 protein [Ignavibacteria bacterium]
MNTSKPTYLVSIIVTVFNRRRKFQRAINSIFSQSFTDLEIIIIDDGSTDSIERNIIPLAKSYSFIKYLRHSNRGAALSLNTGILISEGKYIAFLDSDDEYGPHYLKRRIEFIRKEKCDLIYSPATLIGEEEDFFVPDVRNRNRLIHLNKCVIGATFFGKKEIFLKLGGFRNIYSYDSHFLKKAKSICNVKEFIEYSYRYYRDSSDSILSREKAKNKLQ